MSIPGLPVLGGRPRCPRCFAFLDEPSEATLITEIAARLPPGPLPAVAGLCHCGLPYAIEDDGRVRAMGLFELAAHIVARPETGDVVLAYAQQRLPAADYEEFAHLIAAVRARYPRPKRREPPT